MATRLESYLSHGEISNITPGKVTGVLWLIGVSEPLILELEGNFHSDIAGCTLVFENPDAGKSSASPQDDLPNITMHQTGVAGDMTASKKVIVQESVFETSPAGNPELLNALSLEWYDAKGTRFVIDTSEFALYTSAPEWRMDATTSKTLQAANTKRFLDHIDKIARRISEGSEDGDEFDGEGLLNEFEWEERLKESDRITDAYMEALDKYQDSPNQEQLISAAMGWSHGGESPTGWDGDDDDDAEEFWIEDDDESESLSSESHPLYERCHELSVGLHRDAQEMNLLDSEDEATSEGLTPIQTLVFATMELSSKLAGALNGINQIDTEPGLVVAWLKRGLPVLGRALGAANSAAMQDAIPLEWVEKTREELFTLRSAMLDLIQVYREQLP